MLDQDGDRRKDRIFGVVSATKVQKSAWIAERKGLMEGKGNTYSARRPLETQAEGFVSVGAKRQNETDGLLAKYVRRGPAYLNHAIFEARARRRGDYSGFRFVMKDVHDRFARRRTRDVNFDHLLQARCVEDKEGLQCQDSHR